MKRLSLKTIVFVLLIASAIAVAYRFWLGYSLQQQGLSEIAHSDAQFWLMQGPPNNRMTACTVIYRFDIPLDEHLLKDRVTSLTQAYSMFQSNVVEVNGLPYWQSAVTEWDSIYRVLQPHEKLASAVIQAEQAVSSAASIGGGLPLFRVLVSSDRKQLAFVWHHVISDLEGMFNKHAKHLFHEDGKRTRFGYQLSNRIESNQDASGQAEDKLVSSMPTHRPLGFALNAYVVTRIGLPIGDVALYELGKRSGLPMSDIFSFVSLRAATLYEEAHSQTGVKPNVLPMVSPISLRNSSLELDEGNNRAIKTFPFVFPAETLTDLHQRLLTLEPASSSYESAGAAMRVVKRFAWLERRFREIAMPDYISNYFPLADQSLAMGDAVLVSHDLRVPMVPYERAKFAWSNYNGQVELFLHTDPELIATDQMVVSAQNAVSEVLGYLQQKLP